MLILLIVIIITILVSSNCSLYEAVLYSTRIGTLASAKTQEKHPQLAAKFISMKKNISEPLAAILILNTIGNTAGATIAGMYATKVLGAGFVPVFSIVFTLGILFIGEILPKTVGAVHWRNLWFLIVYPLQGMRYILMPFIFLTQKFTGFLTKNSRVSTITEDEILALVHLGAREGEISHQESQMVKNIIGLEDLNVKSVMTPRTMIFSLDAAQNVSDSYKMAEGKGLSRIPVFEDDKENIIGYVLFQDLRSSKIIDPPKTSIKSLVRPISHFPESTNCLTMLMNFLKNRKQIAIIADEYGGVAGLVSLEDLIETILGTEIVDETDKIVDLQDAARKRKNGKRTEE